MKFRTLIEDLHNHFEQKEDKTHEEEMFLSHLKEELPYFVITRLHRDDLASRGFEIEDVDDSTMQEIAEKMGSAYQENDYWEDLRIIAECNDVRKHRCPKCWGDAGECSDDTYYCPFCHHEWKFTEPTGRYVLVEHPEDGSLFEENEIGFESYQSDDNGARYVPEHLYIAHFEKNPKAKQIYLPIGWPESQTYMEWEHTAPKKFERCEYINPADPILDLGDNALFVPQSLIKKQRK